MEAIKVEKVVKRFGEFTAVNSISFSVEAGKIYGLLGPNGAGKTTTIRMITNILEPNSGEIHLMGERARAFHQNNIGYLPEERGLYKKIKVGEMLRYFGKLKGLSSSQALAGARYWLEKMDALDWENKKIQELSKGMSQKVQFIGTILHNPDILILDEPFSGFDPINAKVIKDIIIELRNQGKTIILSTHIMEQVEQLCENICLINKGDILLKGNVRDIKKSYGRDQILMEFEGNDDFLNRFEGIEFINRSDNRAEFRVPNEEMAREIMRTAIENVNLFKFELMEPSLNEIFFEVVSKSNKSEKLAVKSDNSASKMKENN